jgi:hypothetical protein
VPRCFSPPLIWETGHLYYPYYDYYYYLRWGGKCMAMTAYEWAEVVCDRMHRTFGDEGLAKYEGDPVVKWLVDKLGDVLAEMESLQERVMEQGANLK